MALICFILCVTAIGAGVGALMRTDALLDWLVLPAEGVRFFRNYLRLVAVALMAAGGALAWKAFTWFS